MSRPATPTSRSPALDIAEVTVKLHRGTMMRKMSAATLVDLVRMWDALVRAAE